MISSFSVVIARYSEDLCWLSNVQAPLYIYNKGPSLINNENSNSSILTLSNVGRESHSYVHHIIENYDKLTDIVVFLQGNPFDHIQSIDNLISDAKKYGMSQNKKVHQVGNCSAHKNFTIFVHNNKNVLPFNNYNLGEWYEYITNKKFPTQPVEWYIGACFAATKEYIRSVPKSVWEKIRDSLSYSHDPVTGHYMERSWYLLCAPPTPTPTLTPTPKKTYIL